MLTFFIIGLLALAGTVALWGVLYLVFWWMDYRDHRCATAANERDVLRWCDD